MGWGGAKKVFGGGGGGGGGGSYMGLPDVGGGNRAIGNQFQTWGDHLGIGGNKKGQEERAKAQEALRNSYGAGVYANKDIENHEEAFYNRQTGRDDKYLGEAGAYDSKLVKDIEALRGQAKDQAKNARSTYSNDILPQYKDAMERDVNDSRSAMSLADAGNVNNSVHTGVRNLYEKQAQGVGKQGLADAGVLAALGAQASAGQMGSVPMTGGQMAAIQGQNMAQSGMAYSRAQQQMQSLREQGLNRGFEESDRQFQRGQQSLDRRDRSIGNYEGANNRMNQEQAAFRGEQQGLATQRTGVQQGMAGRDYGVRTGTDQMGLQMDTAQANRTLANDQGYYGAQAGIAQGNAAAADANRTGRLNTLINVGVAGGQALAGMPPTGAGAGAGGGAGAAPAPSSAYPATAQTSYSPGAYGNGYGPQGYQPYAQQGGYQGYYPS